MKEHDGKYRVILADPNWRYANFTDKAHGAAVAHYQTTETAENALIPVLRWAHPDGCLLVVWGTWPKLDQYFGLAAAWGWGEGSWITGFPWVKIVASTFEDEGRAVPKVGIGFWGQHASEVLGIFRLPGTKRRTDPKPPPRLLLICNREGAPDSDDPADRVLYHAIGKHSAKPLAVHDWLEEQSDGPYLELFARRERPGWTTWGLDLGYELTAGGVVHRDVKPDNMLISARAEAMEV